MWTLRKATETDRDTLADMYMVEYEDNYIHALLFANGLVENERTILCVHENNLAGFLCWGIRGILENGVFEISLLNVRPDFRRKGAGKQLIDAAIAAAKSHYEERGFQIRLVYSFMKKKNAISNSFFKSISFIEASEIASFYHNDSAVIWIKRIEN